MLITDVRNNIEIMHPYKYNGGSLYLLLLYRFNNHGSMTKLTGSQNHVTDYDTMHAFTTGDSASRTIYYEMVD